MREKLTVSIVGIGMVGRELERYFREIKGYVCGKDLFLYDTDPKKDHSDDIDKAEIIFICVPTPRNHDGSCNISAVESTVAAIKSPHIVVIKSTIPPGTTETIQRRFPGHKMLFSPEFLTESQAWNDMIRPDRQIVGFTGSSIDAAHMVLALLPAAPFMSPWGSGYKRNSLSATEAEMVKVYGNAFFSLKVTFANVVADSCDALRDKLKKDGVEEPQVDYENVRYGLAADYRIGASHLDAYHGGYRGFGGYCLPKDLDALISFLNNVHVDADIFTSARGQNKALIERQNLTMSEVSAHSYKNHKNSAASS